MNFVNYLIEATLLDISVAVYLNGARPSVKKQLYFRKVCHFYLLLVTTQFRKF